MKLSHAATIATTLVIVAGILMISPMFLRSINKENPPRVAVFLFVTDETNATSWCLEVGSYLASNNIRSTVFFVGSIVDKQPSLVTSFKAPVDVGSMTSNYQPLLSNPDYTAQLAAIKSGKISIDAAGNFESRLFSAPFSSVDDNIFSQLNRSGILADFSYDDHYLKYFNGTFIKMPLRTIEGTNLDAKALLLETDEPYNVVKFSNQIQAKQVIQILSSLKDAGFRFLTASDMAGIQLTNR